MAVIISIFLSIIFLFLFAIHVYWAMGGNWAKNAVLPVKDNNVKLFQPTVLSTCIVAICFLASGVFVLIKIKFITMSVPSFINKYGLWMIAIIFLMRAVGNFKYAGFFKKIKHTQFGRYDTKYYSPLSFIIAILTIILAINIE
jgi:hypothetical protein